MSLDLPTLALQGINSAFCSAIIVLNVCRIRKMGKSTRVVPLIAYSSECFGCFLLATTPFIQSFDFRVSVPLVIAMFGRTVVLLSMGEAWKYGPPAALQNVPNGYVMIPDRRKKSDSAR